MNRGMRVRWRPRRNIGPAVLTCFIALVAFGLPAHGQQSLQGDDHAVIARSSRTIVSKSSASSRRSVIAAAAQCPLVHHWDPGMRMCMPDSTPANTKENDRTPSRLGEIAPAPGPAKMPPAASSAAADRPPPSGMDMPMPGDGKANSLFMFSLNQFLVYSSTSGPRGQTRLTGPGVLMLMYDNDLSPTNHLRIDVMGSLEQLTVGDKGTPQLLQTEHVDAMHAHDTIMALEFRDAVALSTADKQKVTFLFAPRGEAAVGPVPFMHRESAEGNPDAPLGHALQDGFHDVSTVFGIEYKIAHTAVEATAFSGQGISWPIPLHSPDSYSLRVIQDFNDHVSVGASYADVLLPDDMGGAEHNQFISGWLTTSHLIDGNALKSSLIWGQARAGHGPALNSFLGEAVYQLGMNNFYGRAEILQITPGQLGVAIAGNASDARWMKAITVGYERNLFKNDGLSLFAGGSYTHDFTPGEFQPAYGSNPGGVKFYLRVKFDAL
jgi:hypothetical protein